VGKSETLSKKSTGLDQYLGKGWAMRVEQKHIGKIEQRLID
jgi:hypothetical protein